jgi:hypothetical protein
MNLTKIVSAGVVAAGLICSGAYAQTSDSTEGKTHSQALLMAQASPTSGSFKGNPFRGVVDLSVPGGVRNLEAEIGSPTNPAKGQQGGGSGVGADSGQHDTPGSSAGKTSGGSHAPGATSGSGSAGAGK